MNQSPEKFLGITIENPQINKFALRAFRRIAKVFVALKGLEIEGEFPQEGTYILAANHTSTSDGLITHLACFETGHRVFRGTARESLLDPKVKESDEVLERTGKKGHRDFMSLPIISHLMAWDLRGIG